jgi:hypothetical protein
MNRILLIIFISLASFSLVAQNNNDKTEYKGDGIYFKFINPETSEVVNKVPLGKEPYIYYDTFFKRYDIFWKGSDGGDETMSLTYIMEEGEYVKMKDKFGNTFMVFDYIKKSNSLVIMHDKMGNGMIICTVVEGVKKL